ncbi:MAG: hypothetical protein DRH26_02595 [Deltaproteobacteria bacterium]|nr:MAG: hypothetical protein DRH26_02595 [Deltaproteobacteria bacterium]
MFKLFFYTSCIIFILGLSLQMYRFRKEDRFLNPDKKRRKSLRGLSAFSNTLFQVKLFKAGKIRWIIHFLLLVSFLYLLIVHGFYSVTADLLFADYQPTLDPFQALRNAAGFLVLVGCLTFFIRRQLALWVNEDRRIRKKGRGSVILILAVIASGFLLEASKIISEPVFMEMVEEYSGLDGGEDLEDLKLYWKDNYAVFFQEQIETSPERLENGEALNEAYCLYCHSPIKSAAVSKPLAGILTTAGSWMNANRMDKRLYWLHYGLCLMVLICLPFSRLSHLLLIPWTSSRRHLTIQDYKNDSVSINAMTLHACTNCGFCSQVCSVHPNFQVHQNPDILPHAKIESVKALLKNPSSIDLWQLNTGNGACTSCHRCTDICPSGIDLQTLWTVLDKKLLQMGMVDNNRLIGEMPLNGWMAKKEFVYPGKQAKGIPVGAASKDHLTSNLADRIESFEKCIQCTICSNVCPIVDYDSNNIDMSPHQIMNLLRLGKKHLATGTRMVWSCLTCYACQENCPQEIQVTDILLELRNAGSMKADWIQKNRLIEKVDR